LVKARSIWGKARKSLRRFSLSFCAESSYTRASPLHCLGGHSPRTLLDDIPACAHNPLD